MTLALSCLCLTQMSYSSERLSLTTLNKTAKPPSLPQPCPISLHLLWEDLIRDVKALPPPAGTLWGHCSVSGTWSCREAGMRHGSLDRQKRAQPGCWQQRKPENKLGVNPQGTRYISYETARRWNMMQPLRRVRLPQCQGTEQPLRSEFTHHFCFVFFNCGMIYT